MTSPAFNYFYKVEITVARLVLGGIVNGTTGVREIEYKTFSFVNKPLRDASVAIDREETWPILKTIGEVTLAAGEVLPSVSISSFTIDNTRGSFGANRKFSDILERYSVTNQSVSFYVAQTANDLDAPTAWTNIGTGKVVSYNNALNGSEQDLTFQLAPFKLSEKFITLDVSRDVAGMENAPDSSIGRALPVVFNKKNTAYGTTINRNPGTSLDNNIYPHVPATPISATGGVTGLYALTTQMYQVTKAKLETPWVYVKKYWNYNNSPWAAVNLSNVIGFDYTGSLLGGSFYSLNTYASTAYKIISASTDAYMFTAVRFKARGGGLASSNAYLSAFVFFTPTGGGTQVEEIARGQVALSTYNTQNSVAGSTFDVTIHFDKPVIFDYEDDFDMYIGWEATGAVATDLSIYKENAAGTYSRKVKDATPTSTDSYAEYRNLSDTYRPAMKALMVSYAFDSHTNTFTKDGYTYSKLTLSQNAADPGQIAPSLSDLQLIVPMEGFYPYSSSTPIYNPSTIASILSYTWNGESWADANAIDSTLLKETHYDLVFESGKMPKRIPGLVGWYDANRDVTVDANNLVTQWNDQSGNNFHASQATTTNKPLLSRTDNRENLVKYSEQFNQSEWVKVRSSISATDTTTAPDGSLTAEKIVDSTDNASHKMYQVSYVRAYGESFAASIYLKAAELTYAALAITSQNETNRFLVRLNLSTGAFVGSTGTGTYTIENAGSGWWKVSITAALDALDSGVALFVYLSNATGTSYTGTGTNGIYVWGAQLRQSSTDSTYVQTGAQPALASIFGERHLYFDGVDDYLSADGLAAGLSGSDKPHTVFLVIRQTWAQSGTSRSLFSLNSSASSVPFHQYYNQTSQFYYYRSDDAGTVKTAALGASNNATTVLSAVFNGTQLAFFRDGTALTTAADLNVGAATFNRCTFGARVHTSVGAFWNGSIAEVIVYNVALNDTDRQAVESYLTRKWTSSFSGATHRARFLSGIIEQKATYSQALTEIARGSASRVGVKADGKLFLYPWGTTQTPAYNIAQADIIPLSWEVRDDATIINRVLIKADKLYASGADDAQTDGYALGIDYGDADFLPVKSITEQSFSLFGIKNLGDEQFEVFGFNDLGLGVGLPGYLSGITSPSQAAYGAQVSYSVDFLGEYYLTRFALPLTYCSFVVPYHRYSGIKMFDIISFHHSEFPAFFGTDPNAKPGVVDAGGGNVSAVLNANYGQELVRAKTYRGLVEAVSYVLAMEHAPAIRLTVQVLTNTDFDPT